MNIIPTTQAGIICIIIDVIIETSIILNKGRQMSELHEMRIPPYMYIYIKISHSA